MRKTIKLTFTVFAAASLLALAVGQASAGRLSTSHQQFRTTWNSLEFSGEVIGIRLVIRCRVTLEGSFHTTTIAKVRGSLIGLITRATVAHPCEGGEGWALNGRAEERGPTTLPWHLTYEEFRGTLPRIETLAVLLARFGFLIQSGGSCSGSYGNATDNIIGDIARNTSTGALGTLTPRTGRNIASLVTRLGGLACPGTGVLTGGGTVQQLANTSAITVTLI
jgi:hypothetical protein